MIHWMMRILRIQNRIAAVILVLSVFGIVAVGFSIAIQYAVNTYRSTDHWVSYYSVEPVRHFYEVGSEPEFKSVGVWHVKTDAAWYDRMWCTSDSGVIAGMTIRIDIPSSGSREMRYPKAIGMTDENGNLIEGGLAGFWLWTGKVPRMESECWLEPRLKIFPSPLVIRDIPMPSSSRFKFRFGDPVVPNE